MGPPPVHDLWDMMNSLARFLLLFNLAWCVCASVCVPRLCAYLHHGKAAGGVRGHLWDQSDNPAWHTQTHPHKLPHSPGRPAKSAAVFPWLVEHFHVLSISQSGLKLSWAGAPLTIGEELLNALVGCFRWGNVDLEKEHDSNGEIDSRARWNASRFSWLNPTWTRGSVRVGWGTQAELFPSEYSAPSIVPSSGEGAPRVGHLCLTGSRPSLCFEFPPCCDYSGAGTNNNRAPRSISCSVCWSEQEREPSKTRHKASWLAQLINKQGISWENIVLANT